MENQNKDREPPPYTPYPDFAQPGVNNQLTGPNAPIMSQNQFSTYGATAVIVPPEIIIVGACPACRIGILQDDYPCYPLGLLCCTLLKNKRCSNCGAVFG